jgi:hypothetical protein
MNTFYEKVLAEKDQEFFKKILLSLKLDVLIPAKIIIAEGRKLLGEEFTFLKSEEIEGMRYKIYYFFNQEQKIGMFYFYY